MSDPILTLRVAEVTPETDDAVSVSFDAGKAGRLDYRPGQFLTLRVPAQEGWVARCYSLSSAPGDPRPTVTVKRVPGGIASNWICDRLRPGDTVEALLPAGRFTPAPDHRDLLLLAAGSGITPAMSILRARAREGGSALLVYANRDERSVIFAAELRRLVEEHPDRIQVVHWLETLHGLPDAARLAALVRPWAAGADAALLCGPAPFMAAAAAALTALGLDRARVLTEEYRSLASDPFAVLSAAPGPEPADEAGAGTGTGTVTVELDGERKTFPWPARTTLLDLLRAQDLDAPFSCREGSCSACACRVVDGEVKLLRNTVLEEEDLAEGYTLACQAVPLTDHVEVVYD
ncbi:2Fe-2S iron-sulfur cluster-binding protein [Streptomyces sp. NPDC058373]|uniref:2Fe-2S iron-sulfur cluster-binding protein n=1 Tax=Streptomyces sp. NPDC058373 TaxID=3346465 RepID=UPI0036463E66